jgi:hypothetical protein
LSQLIEAAAVPSDRVTVADALDALGTLRAAALAMTARNAENLAAAQAYLDELRRKLAERLRLDPPPAA